MESSQQSAIRLTQFAHGTGCGCKIAPQVLETILEGNKSGSFAALLVGNEGNDDASVFQLNAIEALISTVDFFTPIVDDAFLLGQIAAANALSDVYAMGGKPILALAILGWPVEKLPPALAKQVIEGARSICAEANIPLAGGHSIDSPEPLFGLSVNGLVKFENLKKNSGAQEGDAIFLTKALGTGILSTALKRVLLQANQASALFNQMKKLNDIGSKLGESKYVTAMTDVTGFGLMGHLIEMAEAAKLTAEIEFNQLQLLPMVDDMLSQHVIADATYRNWNAYNAKCNIASDVDATRAFQVLPDPQTNGGLLFSVKAEGVEEIRNLFLESGYHNFAEPIGYFRQSSSFAMQVL
jgi:selenide,water dikinase